jgi:superoxide reductase
MSNRRTFLKNSLVLASGAALLPLIGSARAEGSGLPANIIYTAANPGRWDKKAASHLPQTTVAGDQVTVTVEHGMSPEHYIVKHTLIGADGSVLSEHVFAPTDKDPTSTHSLPAGYKGKLYVTSFCNKHDLWLAEVEV